MLKALESGLDMLCLLTELPFHSLKSQWNWLQKCCLDVVGAVSGPL